MVNSKEIEDVQIRFTTSVSRKTSSSDEDWSTPEAIPPKAAGVFTPSCLSTRPTSKRSGGGEMINSKKLISSREADTIILNFKF